MSTQNNSGLKSFTISLAKHYSINGKEEHLRFWIMYGLLIGVIKSRLKCTNLFEKINDCCIKINQVCEDNNNEKIDKMHIVLNETELNNKFKSIYLLQNGDIITFFILFEKSNARHLFFSKKIKVFLKFLQLDHG